MSRPLLVTLFAALSLACPKRAEETPASLLSQVKQGLTDWDTKVGSYRLSGVTRQQGLEATFGFEYRAPNKMKAHLAAPQKRTFAYDGQKLYELSDDEKKLTTYEMKLPVEKSTLFLTQTFAPFAPEGYRAPLLLREGLSVVRTTHPKATDAVELKMATRDETGQTLAVTYVLRWPSLDFLLKRTQTGSATMEIRVDEEHCDEALKLCFPRQLTQWEAQNPTATTSMTKIELNPELPNEEFTLKAPEGFEAKTRELVESK